MCMQVLFLALLFAANPYKHWLISAVARSLQLALSLAFIGSLAIRHEARIEMEPRSYQRLSRRAAV